jgi:hypothetical protein
MKTLPKLLTAGELSLILDVNLRTVKKLVKTNQLPVVYVNRRLHFDYNEVLAYFGRLEGGAA